MIDRKAFGADLAQRLVPMVTGGETASQADIMSVTIKTLMDHIDKALEEVAGSGGRVLRWAGAHEAGRAFHAGDVTQKGGGLFVALVDTQDAPGASSDWRRLAAS